MPNYKGAKCFVVTLVRAGITFYLSRVEAEDVQGAPYPCFIGHFVPDLMEALKFQKDYEAKYFADKFKESHVEIIKTGEKLKGYRRR